MEWRLVRWAGDSMVGWIAPLGRCWPTNQAHSSHFSGLLQVFKLPTSSTAQALMDRLLPFFDQLLLPSLEGKKKT